jgi:hypothetical protein
MRDLIRHGTVVAGAVVVLLGPAVGAASGAALTGIHLAAGARAASSGSWGTAEEVPGTAALNRGDALLYSVSCAAAGSCSAGGYYEEDGYQAMVAGEVHGTWGRAQEVPGTAALNQGGFAEVDAVSCAAPGTCSAGGSYTTGEHTELGQAFVVNEVHGIWGRAEEVPGIAALNKANGAGIASLSCTAPGSCSAGGTYVDSSGAGQVFVVNEVHGIWGRAEEAPGTAALNQGGDASVTSVSCAAPGTCAAGGWYTGKSHGQQAFVVSEVHGTWRTAEEVPGTAALNKGGGAGILSVSCAPAGTCTAGGYYTGASGSQGFVVSEVNGIWGKAEKVGQNAAVRAVSCPRTGDCSAGGAFSEGSSVIVQAFVVNQVHGTWRTAEEIPGTAALNKDGAALVNSVSCAAPGTCSAGGTYTDSSGHTQVFVVNEVHGIWGRAEEVPGTAALNKGGYAQVYSVSCVAAGSCSAGGYYTDSSGRGEAFIVDKGVTCKASHTAVATAARRP